MHGNLMKDLGENYHYVETIVKNKIELGKIEVAEDSAKLVGMGFLSIIFLILGLLSMIFLLAGLSVYLSHILDSMIQAFLIVAGIIAIIGIILWFLRETLIINPVNRFFYKILSNRF